MTKVPTNSQKVIKGISSQTVVTIALGLVEIVSFSIMSRLLSKEDFGYYAAVMAIVSVFSSFSETGIGSAIIQRKNPDEAYINNAFTMSFLFGLFISVLLFLLSGVLAEGVADSSMRIPLMIMSITLLLHSQTSVFLSIMKRRLEFLRIGAINLFSLVITTILAIWLALIGYGYYAIITKAVLQSIITCFLALYFCKARFRIALDIKTASSIFKFSGWLMASVLFRNLAHQVDRLLMPKLLSITALGAYNRPQDFINQVSSKLNGIFDTALFPVLSDIQDNKEKLQNAFRKSLYLLNIFALVLTLTFAINSELWIRIFFGEKWLNLVFVSIVLSLTLIFNIDGRLADCYLRSMGKTKEQFYFRVFETIIKILGVLLGYKWGILGVAIFIMLTNAIANLVKILFVSTTVDISILKTIDTIFRAWKCALVIVPVSLLLYHYLPDSLIGNIILALLYGILVIVIFLFFPNIVGYRYANEVHRIIKSKLTNMLGINI